MKLSRRRLLCAAAALPLAGIALTSCSGSTAATVTLVQADIEKAINVVAGLNSIVGSATAGKYAIPGGLLTTITGYAGEAETLLGTFAAGAVVPITDTKSFLDDVTDFLNTAQPYLGAVPYFAEVDAVANALDILWGGVVSLAATTSHPDVDTAMTTLSKLPRPHKIHVPA